MVKYRKLAALAAFAALSSAAPIALAAPCVGFDDVDSTSPFCGNVEWMRNREITTGFTATEYRPDLTVTRLQMAAFMTRLGNTLTPTMLTNTAGTGALDLDLSLHVCQVGPLAAAVYPRRAIMYAQFSGLAVGPLQVFGTTSMSVDGVTFARTAPAGIGMRSSTAAATWTNVTQTATVDLNPGTSYWFAFLVERAVEDAGTNDFTEGRCNMTIQVISRTGATSPLDAAASQDNAK